MAAPSTTALMALAIAATMVVQLAMAANYTVADADGWELSSNFQSWAASKNFTVGDVIIFRYSESHNVLEVNEPDYSSCSASNPIETHTGGSTSITLLTSGKRFFICGVPGHCTAGMKLEIDTLATSSPPPSSTDTPPAPPPTVTPSSPSTPPPSASSAPPPQVTPSSPPPTSSPAVPTSPPASPPKAATKPPTKSPLAPSPSSKASPPAPPAAPTPPTQAPTPEPPIPPFPFDQPITPSAPPATPPPPPSSAYKGSFRVHLSVGFGFFVMMLLSL